MPRNEFVAHCRRIAPARYASLSTPDYTSIIDQAAHERLMDYLDDAREQGTRVVNLLPGNLSDSRLCKLAPTLVLEVHDGMRIMQEEIFGPLLPLKTYRALEEVVEYIKDRDQPLALYLFTRQPEVQRQIIAQTQSGGVAINDCGLHVAQHDLPFGGIGASGMGHYHGHEGFLEFSKMRPIFKQFAWPAFPMLYPPYGKLYERLMSLMLGRWATLSAPHPGRSGRGSTGFNLRLSGPFKNTIVTNETTKTQASDYNARVPARSTSC